MQEYLKSYTMKITALSPIHIGSGELIGKKEYIANMRSNSVIIPNLERMIHCIAKKGKLNEYLRYMQSDVRSEAGRLPLGTWLKNQGFGFSDYKAWTRYEMDGGESLFKRDRQATPKGISAFVKDPYGQPYVPGSGIKGYIRSALLVYEITRHPEKYRQIRSRIAANSKLQAGRKEALVRETKDLETATFHTLERDEKIKLENAVNCNLSGLIISDSKPISIDMLTLCQKIDVNMYHEEKPLPILRECLKPGTEIEFNLTIDSSRYGCPYTIEEIMEAINLYKDVCNRYFYSRWELEDDRDHILWLGGGTGYVTKTVTYAMFGNDAAQVVDGIFKNTLGKQYKEHKHYTDVRQWNLSPHTCKCTRYQGRLYDFGKGKIEILRRMA